MALGPRTRVLVFMVFAAVLAAMSLDLGWSSMGARSGPVSVVADFFGSALAPSFRTEDGTGQAMWPMVVDGVLVTLKFALAAMGLALAVGLPLGILAAERCWGGMGFGAVRLVVAAMRSIHELIWAMVLLAAFGLSPATAVVAIAIPAAGTLAKVFGELIDESPAEAGDALRALGAGRSQALLLGVVPRAVPGLISYVFFRFECALRSSAVMGFFGFPTLGYFIQKSMENLYFGEVWAYLYALIGLMALVERWSASVRRGLVLT